MLPNQQESTMLHLRTSIRLHQNPSRKNSKTNPWCLLLLLLVITTSLKQMSFYKGKQKHVYMKVKCLKTQISVIYKKGFKVHTRSSLA